MQTHQQKFISSTKLRREALTRHQLEFPSGSLEATTAIVPAVKKGNFKCLVYG